MHAYITDDRKVNQSRLPGLQIKMHQVLSTRPLEKQGHIDRPRIERSDKRTTNTVPSSEPLDSFSHP